MIKEQKNDSEFILNLYQTYFKSLWGYAYSLCGNKDSAYDIVQTVFLQMMRYVKTLKKITEPQKQKAYLNTSVRNTFYNLRKSEKKYESNLTLDDTIEFPIQKTLEEESEEKDAVEQIKLLTNSLHSREKDIITLYHFVGVPIKEIADMMGLTVSNTKWILQNARKKIRLLYRDKTGAIHEEEKPKWCDK